MPSESEMKGKFSTLLLHKTHGKVIETCAAKDTGTGNTVLVFPHTLPTLLLQLPELACRNPEVCLSQMPC